MMRLGVDTGGTFTDFVLVDAEGRLRIHKVLSTPHAPEAAILRGIREMGLDPAALQLIHGSTVATNAVLEGKGVRTAYVANEGLTDVLTIGRQQRTALYDLLPPQRPPPVPEALCLGLRCRTGADGSTVEALEEDDLAGLVQRVRQLEPEAVAVNLLFSYLDPVAEQRIADALPQALFVALSSRVLPEIREYERGMATWLNASVGPLVAGYLRRLARDLGNTPVSVMQSSGDTVEAGQAAEGAVHMLLSGPAGGLAGARFLATQSGTRRVLSFDMGGTSTDVSLLDGDPPLTTEGHIGPYPVAVPMVDMHTIGAGGGSIAWIDEGGMLQVGPASAGASPGPACYGQGGTKPTVTDANLLLGRLQPDSFLGGDFLLDVQAAEAAIATLALQIDSTPLAVARDIVAVANEHMAQALRAISIKRGVDPGDHLLMSFGGAGGLHVCALADLLDIDNAMIPLHGGVLSAFGMLVAPPGRQLSMTKVALLQSVDAADVDAGLETLRLDGVAALEREGFRATDCSALASVDLRYAGQSYTLSLPWNGVVETTRQFHERHEGRYGHRLDLPVELVNLRQSVRASTPELTVPALQAGDPAEIDSWCEMPEFAAPVQRYRRDQLAAGQQLEGPVLIAEKTSTGWVAPGWTLRVDEVGNLGLSRIRPRP